MQPSFLLRLKLDHLITMYTGQNAPNQTVPHHIDFQALL
jgi:hypothetical protein